MDREIKEGLIYDTLDLVNFPAADRCTCLEEERCSIIERQAAKPRANASSTTDTVTDKAPSSDRLPAYVAAETKRHEEMELKYEDAHLGNYRRIYPLLPGTEGSGKYEKYLNTCASIFQETLAYRARTECAK